MDQNQNQIEAESPKKVDQAVVIDETSKKAELLEEESAQKPDVQEEIEVKEDA